MKKFYLIILFTLLSCALAQAQTPRFTGQQTFHWDAQRKVTNSRVLNEQTQQRLSAIFKAYDVYQIDAQAISRFVQGSSQPTTTFSLALEGIDSWDIQLEAADLLADSYQARVLSASGEQVLARQKQVTYKGHLVGKPDTEVRLMLDGTHISGFIQQEGRKLYIENVTNIDKEGFDDAFLVYNAADVQEKGEMLCLATKEAHHKEQIDQKNQRTAASCSDQTELKIATFATYDRYASAGGTVAVNNEILAILNNVQSNYDDFNVKFTVVEQVVSSCNGCDPWSSPSDPSDLLYKFTNWGPSGFTQTHNEGICFYDGAGSGTVGVAWLATICTSNRYAVCDKLGSSETNRVLVAHEMGHNFSANHDASGSPYIMAPSVNVTSTWSSTSSNAITNHIASRTCLSCVTGETPPAACNAPADLQVSNITKESVRFTWDAATGANTYGVRIREQNASTWTDLSATTNSINITGLSPNTTYQWEVRSTCTNENSSFVSGSNFTTLPAEDNPPTAADPLPWYENFALANGTTSDNGTTGWTSTLQNTNGGFASVQNGRFAINSSTAQWTTAKIDVSSVSATTIKLELQGNYYYTMESSDEIKLEYRADNNNWQQLYRRTDGFSNIRLSGNLTGLNNVSTLQFRITGRNSYTDETYYIDNFSVESCTSCASAATALATTEEQLTAVAAADVIAYPNPFDDRINFQYTSADTKTIDLQIYGLEGKLVYANTKTPANALISLGDGWKPGLYILKVKTANETKQLKIVKR